MSNITGNLNLTKLVHAVRPSKVKGQNVLIIPIEQNNLLLTEKGNVFIDIQGWDIKQENRREGEKNTHIVHQSVPKEVREALKADGKYPPTLGNFVDWRQHAGQEQEVTTSVQASDIIENEQAGEDDLPF